jgi:hypothetical protein
MATAVEPIRMREGFRWKEGGQSSLAQPRGQAGLQHPVRLCPCTVMTHGSSRSWPYGEAGPGGGTIYDDPGPDSPGQPTLELSLVGLTRF